MEFPPLPFSETRLRKSPLRTVLLVRTRLSSSFSSVFLTAVPDSSGVFPQSIQSTEELYEPVSRKRVSPSPFAELQRASSSFSPPHSGHLVFPPPSLQPQKFLFYGRFAAERTKTRGPLLTAQALFDELLFPFCPDLAEISGPFSLLCLEFAPPSRLQPVRENFVFSFFKTSAAVRVLFFFFDLACGCPRGLSKASSILEVVFGGIFVPRDRSLSGPFQRSV